MSLIERCVHYFTTGSPWSSGFVLPDGRVLELGTDHEAIERCFNEEDRRKWKKWTAVEYFMQETGAIRTAFGFGFFGEDDVYIQSVCEKPITDAQKRTLLKTTRDRMGRWEIFRPDREDRNIPWQWGEFPMTRFTEFFRIHERCRVG